MQIDWILNLRNSNYLRLVNSDCTLDSLMNILKIQTITCHHQHNRLADTDHTSEQAGAFRRPSDGGCESHTATLRRILIAGTAMVGVTFSGPRSWRSMSSRRGDCTRLRGDPQATRIAPKNTAWIYVLPIESGQGVQLAQRFRSH